VKKKKEGRGDDYIVLGKFMNLDEKSRHLVMVIMAEMQKSKSPE